jgi:hypothetical protein
MNRTSASPLLVSIPYYAFATLPARTHGVPGARSALEPISRSSTRGSSRDSAGNRVAEVRAPGESQQDARPPSSGSTVVATVPDTEVAPVELRYARGSTVGTRAIAPR